MKRSKGDLRRNTRKIPQRKKFILIAEGKNTEPDYFRAVQTFYRGTLIDIEIVDAAGVPKTIAEKAIVAKKTLKADSKHASWKQHDEVWAIFDRDEHPHVNDALHLCEQHGVGIAFSNTCFELWLILHFEDFNNLDDRHKVQKHLKKLCPEYDPSKGKRPNCEALMEYIPSAEARGYRQMQEREKEGDRWARPVTTVGELTAAIRRAAEQQKR